MIAALILLASLLALTAPAGAQVCPADIDRSGQATVDELAVAIDGGLGQCRADPGCPFGFLDNTLEVGDCVFIGSVQDRVQDPTCVVDDVVITWYADARAVVVVDFRTFTPPLFIGADGFDSEVAEVFGSTDDLSNPATPLGGLLLMDEQHANLGLFIEDSPFVVDGCRFNFLLASYDRFVIVGAGPGAGAAAGRPRSLLQRGAPPPAARELSDGLRAR